MSSTPPLHRATVLIVAVALALTGCGGGSDPAASDGVTVIATTTILGDIATNVVGDSGTVTVLVPVGASPHDYQASAQQVAEIQNADLVVANGLGLEEGLGDILDSARSDGANIIEIAPLVSPIPFAASGTRGDDPHFWLDPLRDAEAAHLIASALARLAPDTDWQGRADVYGRELVTVDGQIQDILSAVPEDQRTLVTSHSAFGYFADRYGFQIIGVVTPGGSTLAEPSSSELSNLVSQVRNAGVPAIFAETTEPTTLADSVAAETGHSIQVIQLYTGSLGEPGGEAGTLAGMLVTNARLIADALS
jgi:zinc/manganese transport system substrate-binding protein